MLGVLVHELVHIVVPIDAKHGKLYRAAALTIGLTGKMVHAIPRVLLQKHLDELAETLGPCPTFQAGAAVHADSAASLP